MLTLTGPAVKTLNAIVGAMAVDALINQIAWLREHEAVTVYSAVPGIAMIMKVWW